jgi:hypothetical protein
MGLSNIRTRNRIITCNNARKNPFLYAQQYAHRTKRNNEE